MPPSLNDDIRYLKGVGPSIAAKLNKLGIYRVSDLLYHFPRAYEDRRNVQKLSAVQEGQKATFHVMVTEQGTFKHRGRIHPRIKVTDGSGYAYLYCFNRGFMRDVLKVGTSAYLAGSFVKKYGVPTFSQFEYELDEAEPNLGIVPVYPLTAGLSQKMMRRMLSYACEVFCPVIQDDLPQVIKEGYGLKPRGEVLKEIHFPRDMVSLRKAKETYTYQEFFKYQVVVALAREKNLKVKKHRPPISYGLEHRFLQKLGFDLTHAQKRVLEEIEHDLKSPSPMNRLVQGDVGSGKTVVCLAAALMSLSTGGQVAFMAPTEILARQHFYTIKKYFEDLPVALEYISGSVKGASRKEITDRLAQGKVDVACGTHALFSDDVQFKNLSLVIIDEQHKFGVLQRGRLRAKGSHPDCIVMSATPIPRTLSMTLYGDLDVSIIDELPRGRGEVYTYIVKQAEIEKVYTRVKKEVQKGRQAYFIYPLIEESASIDLRNAMDAYQRLKDKVFKDYRVVLLHGRMADEEKDRVMGMFGRHRYDILVATTVVEVGIDVPNATVMVIEQTERFGLSNIHQLRGRIGRGGHHSYCFLVPDRSAGKNAFSRLRILKDTRDGFKIAEWDLKLRGPGEIMGKKQSGVPSFIIDDMGINTRLIYRAQKDARRFTAGEIAPPDQTRQYLEKFIKTEAYGNAVLYFGG